jgi:hypothetical protein
MFSPLSVTIIILLSFLLAQFMVDSIRSRRQKGLRRQLFTMGMQSAQTSVSVVVKAGRRQGDVIRLLDDLQAQSYDKLEIVVIPRGRTSRRSSAYLRKYQASYTSMNLRIVSTKQKITPKLIAARYAKGRLILWLAPDQQLPQNFFKAVSYEFTDPQLLRLNVPYITQLSNSLSSALVAWSGIRRQTISLLRSKSYGQQLSVYRRTAVMVGDTSAGRPPRLPLMMNRPYHTRHIRDLVLVFINIAVLATAVYSFSVAFTTEWLFAAVAAIMAYLLTNLLWMVSLSGYSYIEKIALLICLPFAIIGNPSGNK